jgi:hypothetical protein
VKTAIGSLTLALALIVTPAAATAAEGPRLVPPKEYDRPFGGTVRILLRARVSDIRRRSRGRRFVCRISRRATTAAILVAAATQLDARSDGCARS